MSKVTEISVNVCGKRGNLPFFIFLTKDNMWSLSVTFSFHYPFYYISIRRRNQLQSECLARRKDSDYRKLNLK